MLLTPGCRSHRRMCCGGGITQPAKRLRAGTMVKCGASCRGPESDRATESPALTHQTVVLVPQGTIACHGLADNIAGQSHFKFEPARRPGSYRSKRRA